MIILDIYKKNAIVNGIVELPASKSISNRLLVIRSLCHHPFLIHNLSDAEDTRIMQELVEKVIGTAHQSPGFKIPVPNSLPLSPSVVEDKIVPLVLDARDAGTVLRFLTALLSVTPGCYILTGSERMKQRPVSEMVEALIALGAHIKCTAKKGFPPILINGRPLPGGKITLDASRSSQFLTALLLVAPAMRNGLEIQVLNKIASRPYVDMTIKLLNKFNVDVVRNENRYMVSYQDYIPNDISVETDWSSASFWYETVALADDGDLMLKNLPEESIQGDAILIQVFERLGVKTLFEAGGAKLIRTGNCVDYFEFDFSNYPDLVPAVAVTCAARNIPARLKGIRNLEIKESPRISALCSELGKMNFNLWRENNDSLLIGESHDPVNPSALLDSYHDHRMAMAFAPLALKSGKISILDSGVVSKSYPTFWKELEKAEFVLTYR
ncbi:MAG: 3-phosphoshikimate 1-carboxyvinyltransferase [Bacteroidetes bacterium]|nr:3-phosphoshikimate 1-carboxyvinyltransferase [Bacteroidota bacterium]